MNKVIFIGRECAETIGPWPDWALISISDPNPYGGKPKIQSGWAEVLRMEFTDTDIVRYAPPEDETIAVMTHEQAVRMVEFISQVASKVEGIVVHCLAGTSRSAAVAEYIAMNFKLPFSDNYDKFNKHVFELLKITSKTSP